MNNSELPILSIIIPIFNESDILAELIDSIFKTTDSIQASIEIIFIDDGSTDGSWNFLKERSRDDSRLKGIRFWRSFGKEAAIRAGLMESHGNAVIVMDGDLQHPPSLISIFWEQWNNGFLVVEAVKEKRPAPDTLRELFSRLFYVVLNKLTSLNLSNACDYKLLDRKVVDIIKQFPEQASLFRGLVLLGRFKTFQIPIKIPPRHSGHSQWSLWKLFELAVDTVTALSLAPLRIVTICSILLVAFSILLGVDTFYVYLSGKAVEGFTTVIICISLVGGIIAGALGIMGEYIARIYQEVKNRPLYLIAEKI